MMVQHYKGSLYFIIEDYATHTETEEAFVVYRSSKGRVFVRPRSMFWENVEYQGKQVPRFKPII